jgi:uncharacterized membrane protein YeaQ/YmgE (transglycosylase-associated protein family)
VTGRLLLGLAGSVIGGVLAVAFTGRTPEDFHMAGLLGSVVGAIAALLVYRMRQPRGLLSRRRDARL